jgi:hypothetical protein
VAHDKQVSTSPSEHGPIKLCRARPSVKIGVGHDLFSLPSPFTRRRAVSHDLSSIPIPRKEGVELHQVQLSWQGQARLLSLPGPKGQPPRSRCHTCATPQTRQDRLTVKTGTVAHSPTHSGIGLTTCGLDFRGQPSQRRTLITKILKVRLHISKPFSKVLLSSLLHNKSLAYPLVSLLFTLCRISLTEYTRVLRVVAGEPLYLGAILALIEGRE